MALKIVKGTILTVVLLSFAVLVGCVSEEPEIEDLTGTDDPTTSSPNYVCVDRYVEDFDSLTIVTSVKSGLKNGFGSRIRKDGEVKNQTLYVDDQAIFHREYLGNDQGWTKCNMLGFEDNVARIICGVEVWNERDELVDSMSNCIEVKSIEIKGDSLQVGYIIHSDRPLNKVDFGQIRHDLTINPVYSSTEYVPTNELQEVMVKIFPDDCALQGHIITHSERDDDGSITGNDIYFYLQIDDLLAGGNGYSPIPKGGTTIKVNGGSGSGAIPSNN